MKRLKALGGFAYLASPYSRYPAGPEWAHADVCQVAGKLIMAGVRVFCPIAHSHSISSLCDIDPGSHDIWLPADAPLMDAASCCVVATLPSWRASFGVAKEIEVFRAARKPIFLINPTTLLVSDYDAGSPCASD